MMKNVGSLYNLSITELVLVRLLFSLSVSIRNFSHIVFQNVDILENILRLGLLGWEF